MKILIIEDEELAALRLERMIKNYDKSIEVLATLESNAGAIEWFGNNPSPDLIFLDIHLEDGLSFSIFDKVEVTSPIIFTTAFDEYAIKAFKLKSIDYLLKPIVQDELNNAINKYRNWSLSDGGESKVDLNALKDLIAASQGSTTHFKERFSVQVGQKIKTFGIEEIAYFHSEDGITFFVTRQGKNSYTLDIPLEKLMEDLNPQDFFRVNRAFIVRIDSIANVHVFPKSRLKLDLNPPATKEVYVSVDKVTQFKTWLNV